MMRPLPHLWFLDRLFLLSQQIKFRCLGSYPKCSPFRITLFRRILMFINPSTSKNRISCSEYLIPLLFHFLLELPALAENLRQALLKYGFILRLIHLSEELQVLRGVHHFLSKALTAFWVETVDTVAAALQGKTLGEETGGRGGSVDIGSDWGDSVIFSLG